jgi:hypothetical protein
MARLERIAVGVMLTVAVGLAVPTLIADPSQAIILGMDALYGVVGALLALRRPRNPIGWIFLGILLVFSISSAASAVGGAAVQAGGRLPDGLPLVLIWFEGFVFQALFGLYYGLTLVFPSGRLPGGRIGRAVRFSLLVPIAGVVVSAFGPHLAGLYAPDTLGRTLDNPVALLPFPDGLDHLLEMATVSLLVCGVVAMIVRFRRARGIEREQLKWLVASLALTGVLVVAAVAVVVAVPRVGAGIWGLAVIGYATIPPAVGVAVLRYRLYEIDRIVSRTIGWAAVSAVLVAVFAAMILAAQAALAPVITSNTLAVAVSTLVVAALFQPLRRWIQARVDRRFNRARYDADITVAAFAGRLRDEVDLTQLATEVVATADRSVQPASIALWLRG